MPELQFIQDLAIIMSIAGLVSIIFYRLKQPIVLGYILVGVIVGPHTPPFALINDENSIHIFSELGVIFLMFYLGLEFSLRNLMKVGMTAVVVSFLEISVMILIGYEIGQFFHWNNIDSLFLGAILAISSTTIIVKTLSNLGLSKQHFAQLIFGVLVVEDILAIAILALLSSIGTSESIDTVHVAITLGKLLLFLIVSLLVGILTIPRLIAYVAKFKNQEILLIAVLGLCFGFCLLVMKLHYSIVLGAFIMGAIIAESVQATAIEHLVEPLRNMFSAVFFVAIGLMLDPKVLIDYATPIIIITVAVILGKVITCSIGTFITGQGAKTGLRVGMGLAQIGEFSFIIASLGLSLNVTSKFLYPIAVSVSALTTLFTPYLIHYSDPLAEAIKKVLPTRITDAFKLYTTRLQNAKTNKQKSPIKMVVQKSLLQIFLNLALVAAIFISIPQIEKNFSEFIFAMQDGQLKKAIFWGSALLFSLPFLIAVYRKLMALSMLLAEISVKQTHAGRFTNPARYIITALIPVFSMLGIMLLIFILSANILPSIELLLTVIAITLILAIFLWDWFVKLHSRLQISLIKTMEEENDKKLSL